MTRHNLASKDSPMKAAIFSPRRPPRKEPTPRRKPAPRRVPQESWLLVPERDDASALRELFGRIARGDRIRGHAL